jgi:hypothetical protein
MDSASDKGWSNSAGVTRKEGLIDFNIFDAGAGLQQQIQSGHIAASERDVKFVDALAGLNDRNNPFKDRCVHALAFVETVTLAHLGQGGAIEVRIMVWFRRALFGLSAHPSVKIVLDTLITDSLGPVTPTRVPIPSDGSILRSPLPQGVPPDKFDFSIAGLLRSCESEGLQTHPHVVPASAGAAEAGGVHGCAGVGAGGVHGCAGGGESVNGGAGARGEWFGGLLADEEWFGGLLADGVTLRPHQQQNLRWALSQEDCSLNGGGGGGRVYGLVLC